MTRLARLEDFGARRTVSPQERKEEYAKQCREMPEQRQAKFWHEMLEHDPEVAKLVGFEPMKKSRRPW